MKYIALITLMALTSLANAETITGRVVGVSDGDTVTLLDSNKHQIKVRLAQIDAPEKAQDYGQASKQALSDAVFGKDVSVEVETIDKYGRTVGKILVAGIDANLSQVQTGMAWVYRQYAKDQAYFSAEDSAKAAKIGLWSQSNPIPPWDFRHNKKGKNKPAASEAQSGQVVSSECGTKQYCKEMKSCSEAKHYLNDCGQSSLDRDGDGKPCEKLCK